MVFACCCLVLYFLGLGETYLNQARSALQQDFNGKAVDCVMEAINVLARYASLLINHSITHTQSLSYRFHLFFDLERAITPRTYEQHLTKNQSNVRMDDHRKHANKQQTTNQDLEELYATRAKPRQT